MNVDELADIAAAGAERAVAKAARDAGLPRLVWNCTWGPYVPRIGANAGSVAEVEAYAIWLGAETDTGDDGFATVKVAGSNLKVEVWAGPEGAE